MRNSTTAARAARQGLRQRAHLHLVTEREPAAEPAELLLPVAVEPAEPAEPWHLLRAELPPPERCPVTLYLANDLATAASRRGALSNLRRAARILSLGATDDPRWLAWHQLDNRLFARLRTLLLEQGAAPAGVNVVLAVCRGVLKQVWRLGDLTADQLARLVDVKRARGGRVDRTGRCLSAGEVFGLLGACCDGTRAGIRDAALFGLALGGGLRRAELGSLLLADYRPPQDGQAAGELVVRGKGNKERRVYITNGAADALADWLAVRGDDDGRLFLPVNRGDRVVREAGAGVSGSSIHAIMAKRAEQAGVASFSPHDCRRTYISGLLDAGVDIATAAGMAGHAGVNTTMRYDRRGERAQQQAAATVHIPYRRQALAGL